MEQTKIIMQCPKCKKEYSVDSSYCDSCSTLLEPIETGQTRSDAPTKDQDRPLQKNISSPTNEKIEDVKIDTLKADVENKFVSALLHEMGQLKKRLVKKEKAKKEKDIGEIKERISKLKSILANLKKKIEADVSELNSQINNIHKPGFFWFLNKNGRYYKMLCSELRTKNTLMDIMSGKKSPNYFKLIRLKRLFFLTISSAVISLIIAWFVLTYIYQTAPSSAPVLSSLPKLQNAKKITIKEKDIINLLEDIKRANLNKDLKLWESRYSKTYLEMEGKRENLLEQWRKFDFRSLRYRVSDINIERNRASALITWEIELLSRQKTEAKIFLQQIYADFAIENGKLKISSVRKK